MTAYLAHYHYREGGRSLIDLLERGVYAGGWGKSAYDAVRRLQTDDILYVRTTPKKSAPDHLGFVGKAVVVADPRAGEEVTLEFPDLDGHYEQGDGPYPELLVPIRWLGRVSSFEDRVAVHVGQGFRGTTTRLRENEPRHVEMMRRLDDLFAGGAGETVMTPAQLKVLGRLPTRGSAPPDPEVEEAGMVAVETYFASQGGWRTDRVEHQNLGWDIEARRADRRLNVEVKATRSAAPNFTISTNELDAGPDKPGEWLLAVLTRATLPNQDRLKWYSAEQARAVATPTDYSCRMDPEEAADSPFRTGRA